MKVYSVYLLRESRTIKKETLHTIKVREDAKNVRRLEDHGRSEENARERERMKGGVTRFCILLRPR